MLSSAVLLLFLLLLSLLSGSGEEEAVGHFYMHSQHKKGLSREEESVHEKDERQQEKSLNVKAVYLETQ
jgi:hypothetical protein